MNGQDCIDALYFNYNFILKHQIESVFRIKDNVRRINNFNDFLPFKREISLPKLQTKGRFINSFGITRPKIFMDMKDRINRFLGQCVQIVR